MIKRLTILSVLLISISFLQNSFSQTNNWPKTLLWRISGKDLKKPSYLFGTMHLQDKRVFNLGDSFYYHFERSEGFAIEVDFNEYLDSVINKTFAELEQQKLRGDDDPNEGVKDIKIDVIDTVPSAPPTEASQGIKISAPTKKWLRKMRNERIRQLLIHGEMPTILDAYLYGMAMKQNKWLGAVEDVKDQLNIKDELGKDLNDDEINQPGDKLLFTLESLLKIYLDQDLSGIEKYTLETGSSRFKNIIFNGRNIKMAKSIDSLSPMRSMFYAVGAAHLPGDSGLITLLRKKGYTLTPVFSNTKMAAEKYAENLPSLSWFEVRDTMKYYSIEMPGIPKEYNIFGELIKMKVFVDITTMSFYMTGSTISQFEDDKLEAALKDIAKSMSANGRSESIKKVDRPGIKAVEGLVYGGGIYYRVQLAKKGNQLYIIMLGAEKKPTILTKGADRYFASFKPLDNPDEGKPANWKELSLPDKGMKLWFPSEPKLNKALAKMAEGTGWEFTIYDCTDIRSGMYFIAQVRDIGAGRYLDGDSNYFALFKNQLADNIKETVKDETTLINGFPVLRFDGLGVKDVFYKTKNLIRGNRIYSLMVVGAISKKDDPLPERFFNSLELTDYIKADWKFHAAPDSSFTAWGADKYVLNTEEEKDEEDVGSKNNMLHYVSYNPLEVISYEVMKTAVPAYYWAESDSAFYASKLSGYNSYLTKQLSDTVTKNGKLNGREKLIQMPNNNNLMKVRVFLHGDTLYTLMSFIPTQYIDNVNHKKFFDEFRVKNDQIKSAITVNKAEKLIQALQSKDSATHAEASSVLYQVEFKKSDLPVLHKALLLEYPDDSVNYYSTRTKIVNALNDISDSSTVDYVKKNYHQLSGKKEVFKISLLNVLANQQTTYSYTELKNLLLNHLPKETGTNDGLSYQLNDSLLLTRKLFPELLTLSGNKFMWKDVLTSTVNLLDSNMISIDMVRPHEKDLLFHIDTLVNGTASKEEGFWGWSYINLAHLTGKLNTAASNTSLQKLVTINSLDLKEEAIVRLLENNQPVDAKEIEKLAASNEYRLSFYHNLEKINKLSFFPAKYRTQRYFAEAELYGYDDEDYFPETMELVAEKEAVFDGKKQRFFLFKLKYDGADTYTWGIAGPYDLDSKNLETTNDVTLVDYDEEEFDKKKITQQLEKFLKQGEEYLIQRKEWDKKKE